MPSLTGVHLLPATGEFTYDTLPYIGARAGVSEMIPINTYYAPGGEKTDYSYSIDQLQASHPECTTVSLVCSWFCDGVTAGACDVYPSTTYLGANLTGPASGQEYGYFEQSNTAAPIPARLMSGAPAPSPNNWLCSSLNQNSPGIIPIPVNADGSYWYGGTPSDDSLVRCIRDLKSRGFKIVFYPFLLMTSDGQPWRGRISYSPDVSAAATDAVGAFLGSAEPSQFTPDFTNLTVAYSGSPTDWTFRRMILHYANLMAVAGGINLFVIGSELRGLETIRGPGWTLAGTTDGGGHAIWDYPFVAGLTQLAADVRSVFDGAGYAKNATTLQNLIAYSADWSSWMGWQHAGANGQWPHLDSLFASSDIDFVSFDNYLPLTDWTTAADGALDGGLDAVNWQAPVSASWPPFDPNAVGYGLSGAPTIYSKPYIKANIEGGQYFNWFYSSGASGGHGTAYGPDPNGSGLMVTVPTGDRLTQTRERYYPNQQILANKQLRWWWNNPHQAVYDDGDGSGWSPHGPTTEWVANSKPIITLEYGVPACDKATNQPNVFYAPASSESATAWWSIWQEVPGGGYLPLRDDTIGEIALDAIHEYWVTDTPSNNESVGGVVMLQWAFCCVWTWDARPFPTFPLMNEVWGDAANWQAGNWFSPWGRAALPPVAPSPDPSPGIYPTFPALSTLSWSVYVRPQFETGLAAHVLGRESRVQKRAYSQYEFEFTYELLRAAPTYAELQQIAGFYNEQRGRDALFWVDVPIWSALAGQALGTGDGETTSFPLVRTFESYREPVLATSGVGAVYLAGIAQGTGWSVTSGYAPEIEFATAPAEGVVVSADFGALYLCRFSEDVADFENFMALFWEFQTCKLQTVRP